jgi:hypothetical protein
MKCFVICQCIPNNTISQDIDMNSLSVLGTSTVPRDPEQLVQKS